MALLVDRKGIQDFIYGRGGVATANFLNNPPRFRSPNTKYEFNVDKANQILEAAGWKKGADGIRAKGNVKLKFVFQTSRQPAAPEDAGHRQGRLHQGRHRPRAEERDGGGVLRQRRRQPGHVPEVLVPTSRCTRRR